MILGRKRRLLVELAETKNAVGIVTERERQLRLAIEGYQQRIGELEAALNETADQVGNELDD